MPWPCSACRSARTGARRPRTPAVGSHIRDAPASPEAADSRRGPCGGAVASRVSRWERTYEGTVGGGAGSHAGSRAFLADLRNRPTDRGHDSARLTDATQLPFGSGAGSYGLSAKASATSVCAQISAASLSWKLAAKGYPGAVMFVAIATQAVNGSPSGPTNTPVTSHTSTPTR